MRTAMTRDSRTAVAAVDHLRRSDLDDEMVFDAERVRLIEIGDPSRRSIRTCL